MKKNIVINGINFTDLFTPTGYAVSYQKIKGKNARYMLDGSYMDDVLAVKAIVTCVCMPTSEEKLSQLLSVLSETYVYVYYFDLRQNAYRTAEMMPSDPSQQYRGTGTNALDYWTGTVVKLTER